MIWCVHVEHDGRFRRATSGTVTVTDWDEWARLDPGAAGQFIAHPRLDVHERVQAAFMRATGLSGRDTLVASMTDAHNLYGGTHVSTQDAARLHGESAAGSR